MTAYLNLVHNWNGLWWVVGLAYLAFLAAVTLAALAIAVRPRGRRLTTRERIAAVCLAIVLADLGILLYLGSSVMVAGVSLAILSPSYALVQRLKA